MAEARGVTLAWSVRPDEHLRAIGTLQEHHARRRRRIWRELRVLAIALLAAAMVAGMVAQFRRARTVRIDELWMFGAPAALIALYHVTRPAVLRRAVRRHLRRNPASSEERRYTLDDVGLHITGDTFTLELPWSDLRRAQETPEFFLFFSKRSAFYLPKRAIVWPDRVESVRELVQRGAGERWSGG